MAAVLRCVAGERASLRVGEHAVAVKMHETVRALVGVQAPCELVEGRRAQQLQLYVRPQGSQSVNRGAGHGPKRYVPLSVRAGDHEQDAERPGPRWLRRLFYPVAAPVAIEAGQQGRQVSPARRRVSDELPGHVQERGVIGRNAQLAAVQARPDGCLVQRPRIDVVVGPREHLLEEGLAPLLHLPFDPACAVPLGAVGKREVLLKVPAQLVPARLVQGVAELKRAESTQVFLAVVPRDPYLPTAKILDLEDIHVTIPTRRNLGEKTSFRYSMRLPNRAQEAEARRADSVAQGIAEQPQRQS